MPVQLDPDAYLPHARFATADGSGNITGGVAGMRHLLIVMDDAAPDDVPKFDSGDETDIRRLLFALLHRVHRSLAALPAADRPARMTASAPAFIDTNTEILTRTFSFTFQSGLDGEEVIDEPV